MALYPQLAGRVVGGDLEALFAAARHRADLLVDGPHADGPSETLRVRTMALFHSGDVFGLYAAKRGERPRSLAVR
jgi:hypothetical protein